MTALITVPVRDEEHCLPMKSFFRRLKGRALAIALMVLLPGAAPAGAAALELTVSPQQPSVFSPARIRLRIGDSAPARNPLGAVSFEIRPVDPKIRSLGSERIDNADWIAPDTAQAIHNWRISGAYEVVATLTGPDGSALTTSLPVNAVESSQLGFWSETWLKAVLFVALSVLVLLLTRRASSPPSLNSQTPESSGKTAV